MKAPEAANPAPEGQKDYGMNKADRFKKYAEIDAAAMGVDLAHWKARAEQAEVQLAGCSVAALGWATAQQEAKEGDYGWSVAYSDVVKLRAQLSDAQEKNRELVRRNIVLSSAMKQAYGLIEQGMEIRAKTLIGSVLDALLKAHTEGKP